MTWKQFKEAVENGGVTDDMDVWYIHVSVDEPLVITLPPPDGWLSVGFSVSN